MDKKYLVAIAKNPKFGSVRLKKLISHFGDYRSIYEGNIGDFTASGLDKNTAKELYDHIKNTDPDKVLEVLKRHDIRVVTIFDDEYPERLKEIHTPPIVLYVKGKLKKDEACISIVGTRKPTSYGMQATKNIAKELGGAGITVVSGLALGIDAIAHQAVVENEYRTIAVLGNGLDRIYPTTNERLADKILETGGAIISEYPIGTPPLKQHFPARNRIVSGLSLGVIITEAAENSGSLITARDALEQNREVFALPGNIYNKNSIGPNGLLKMGAKVVTEANDISEELNLENLPQKETARKIYPATKEEGLILEFIETEPKHVDDIIKTTNIEANAVSSTLTMMEIKGKVKHLGGMVYAVGK